MGLRQLETAGCYDELDICTCACLEDVVREVQLVECAYVQSHQENQDKGKGRFGISEEAALFAGTHGESGDHMICPDLVGLRESGGRERRQHHETDWKG